MGVWNCLLLAADSCRARDCYLRVYALTVLGFSLLQSCSGALSTPEAPSVASHQTAEGVEGGVDVLTFFVIVLVIGVATYHVLAVTKIPYTALLIVWGVLLGVANETYDSGWKLLGPGTQAWQNINPTLLLTAFLPVLLFAAGFGLEWQYIRRLLGSSLLLAGPGVLFGAGSTAVLVKYSFPYRWTWVECLLFGAMFSATDPVAVVAVLKETGMPKKTRTLVDLEALLNDGTAYVLFTLLKTWAEGKHQTAGDSFRLFFQLTAGGVATGAAFGLAVTLWLRFMYNKPLAEISLTLAAAYGTYIVGEQLFGVSPVLAIVSLGLWMAAKGGDHISRKVDEPLHLIWEVLEFIANTLIFVLSGAVIAGRIYESFGRNESLIQAADWGYALLLWVYLTVVRAGVFVLCWPLLNWWGYVISPREAAVVCWSGLRGAVGLSLALFVLLDDEIADQRFRTLAFFHMGCVAFLTIVLQGTSMKPLLQYLKMTKTPAVKRTFLSHVIRRIEEQGEECVQFAKYDRALGEPDWLAVQRASDLDSQSLLRRQSSKLGSMRASSADLDQQLGKLAMKLDRKLLVKEQRTRLLLAVRQTYNDFFQDHYVSTGQVFRLRMSADRALDDVEDKLTDWEVLRGACRVPSLVCFAQRWTGAEGVACKLARYALAAYLETAAVLALAFCHSHRLAALDMARYQKLETWEAGAAAGFPFGDIVDLMRRNVSEQVLAESSAEIKLATEFIGDLQDTFPEVLKSVKTAQLAKEMLIFKEEYISGIGQTGLLEEVEVEQLLNLVEFKLSKLHFSPPRFTWPGAAALLAEHPLFAQLDAECFNREVMGAASLRFFNQGRLVPEANGGERFMTILLRGKARLDIWEQTGPPCISSRDRLVEGILSSGSVFGGWSWLLQKPCSSRITLVSGSLMAQIPVKSLQRLMKKCPCTEAAVWQYAGATLALMCTEGSLAGRTFDNLLSICRHAKIEKRKVGDKLLVAGAVLLLSGSVQRQHEWVGAEGPSPATVTGPCLLPQIPAVYQCVDAVLVLHLPASLDLVAKGTGPAFSKSALAELVKKHPADLPDLHLSRLSAPLPSVRDVEAADGGGNLQFKEDARQQPEAEASLGQNRRRSLAHGWHSPLLNTAADRAADSEAQLV